MNLVALSVPIFLILMAIEFILGQRKYRKIYAFSDFIANISNGIGQQVLGAFFGILTYWAYAYLYDEWRFFTIPNTWYTAILCFLGVDFFYYWFHRLSHEINAIWATHIVHHQSEEYNLSVALRQSWFQVCFSWLFYIPLSLLGFSPTLMLIIVGLNTLYQFWIHTKLIKNMGILEHVLNTPSHHRVHHGTNPKYLDKNHAGSLIIWDKLFGTFQKEEEEVVYGITSPLKSWNPLYANFHYWKELIDHARKTDGLKNKIRIFCQGPSRLAPKENNEEAKPEILQKFDIPVANNMKVYVFFQFLFSIAVVTYYMFFANDWLMNRNMEDLLKVGSLALFIMLTIYSLSRILENKNRVWLLESVRILGGLGIVFLYLDTPWFIYLIIGYSFFQIFLLTFVFYFFTQITQTTNS